MNKSINRLIGEIDLETEGDLKYKSKENTNLI